MGCCIITPPEVDFSFFSLERREEEIEKMGMHSTAEYLVLNSSSSIIMFESNPADSPARPSPALA